jgi:hypothetical protein
MNERTQEVGLLSRLGASVAVLFALTAGIAIGYIDTRPTWDDAGITAGATLLSAAILAGLAPRVALLVALGVGLPIWFFNYPGTGHGGSYAVLAIALLGAGLGYGVARLLSLSAARS